MRNPGTRLYPLAIFGLWTGVALAGVYPLGDNGKQFARAVRFGMTPAEAIQSATIVSAELLGWEDRVGRIAPGMYADIIAVNGNPLEDIEELEDVDFVMKGGVVYKNR